MMGGHGAGAYGPLRDDFADNRAMGMTSLILR